MFSRSRIDGNYVWGGNSSRETLRAAVLPAYQMPRDTPNEDVDSVRACQQDTASEELSLLMQAVEELKGTVQEVAASTSHRWKGILITQLITHMLSSTVTQVIFYFLHILRMTSKVRIFISF
jgi:hypothetical protein